MLCKSCAKAVPACEQAPYQISAFYALNWSSYEVIGLRQYYGLYVTSHLVQPLCGIVGSVGVVLGEFPVM